MANLATKAGVEGRQRLTIHTPLIQLTKAQIIRRGLELGVDYSLTSTCYDPSPDGNACGQCDACLLRLKGFAENGITDPAAYVTASEGAGLSFEGPPTRRSRDGISPGRGERATSVILKVACDRRIWPRRRSA